MEKFDPNTVYEIPVKQILADDDFNCRGRFSTMDVADLAKSIKADGLHEPIIVQPWLKDNGDERVPGKRYRVVAGHRRLRASQLIESPTIRSLVRTDLTESEARLLNLTENLSRKDLTISQEARALMPLKHWRPSDIAQRIGRSTGWVGSRLKFLELPDEIQDEIEKGVIPQTLILDLSALPSWDQMYEFVRKYKEAKLKGNKKEVTVDNIRRKNLNVKHHPSDEELFEIQETIINLFGHGLATRILAYAAAEITPRELHETIRDEALKVGKFHAIPQQYQLHGLGSYARSA